MVAENKPLISKADVIRADLEHMTARWGELPVPAVFELRAFQEGGLPKTAKFAPDWIDDAVDWAASLNELGYNIYVVRNPIRHDVSGSASDDDIIAAFFLWADCDDPDSAGNVKRFSGPKFSASVVTGDKPSTRVHVYWQLDTPCTDMDRWRNMQMRIAGHFNSDGSVVNPSRIMRLAGTVAFPAKHKREKGYTKFLATIRTEFPDTRTPVSLEQMDRVFPEVAPKASASTFNIDDDPTERRSANEYADILRRARTDGEKHTGVRDLSASLAGSGVPRSMAEAIIREACPVWDDNVEDLLNTAYNKFYDPQEVFEKPPADDGAEDWPTPLLDFDEISLPRRQWIYGTDYIRKYVSVVASAGGVGKTSQAIVEAMSIITNRPLLKVAVKEQCNVWVINLEDPLDELKMRTFAAMKYHEVSPDDLRGKLFLDGEDTISITLAMEGRDGVKVNDNLIEAMQARIIERQIGVVIIDPFVSTHLVNENSNASIQAVVALLRDLARKTEAAISLVHHTRKGNGEDASVDSVRGAGSLIGAARAVRVINRLPAADAERLGIPPNEARSIFRVDDGKANLAPPAESAVYRKMIGVQLANEEWVGVTTAYELPDEWSGMTDDIINEMLRQIENGIQSESGEERYSIRPQDKTRWVGQVITDYPFPKAEDFKSEAQARAIVKQWLKSGLIEEVEYYSAAQRKDRKGVSATGRVGAQS